MSFKPLTEIRRAAPEAVLAGIRSDKPRDSAEAAMALVASAKQYDLSFRDYLRLAIDPKMSQERPELKDFTNGYEAALAYCGLPVRNDFDAGVTLDLASDTFNTFAGTRALFPEVIDDMVQWKYRQDNFENIEALVGNQRTVSGPEMITSVVDDKADDYKGTRPIAEMANIPVRSIRATEKSVRFYKIGGGYRVSYEFSRRARLDMLTPFIARMGRELEKSKVSLAVDLLVNGDGTSNHPAAGVTAQSSFNPVVDPDATAGKISWEHFTHWLIARAKAGTPVDTVCGNWDAYIQWLMLFARPIADNRDRTAAANLAASGYQIGGVPILSGTVNFALASDAPSGKLIGFSKADTLEQLTEAGSLIDEEMRAPNNQTISYYKTENSGPRLVFGDTRDIYDFAN